jgi:hypothetical protein
MRMFRRADGRYYLIAQPHQDLLGDWVIMTIHGSIRSRQGGVHTYLAAMTTLDDLVKMRVRHGYSEMRGDTDSCDP